MPIKIGDKVYFIGNSYFIRSGSIGVVISVNPPVARFEGGESSLFIKGDMGFALFKERFGGGG